MAKSMSVKDALKFFETNKGIDATKAEKVELYGQCPPLDKMDATLSTLKACKHLSLSTNNIEKISSLSGLDNLQILSLGRNQIKKIEGLDGVSDTLEELWISYNLIDKMAGLEKCTKLRVLYMSNNKIVDWKEIDRLSGLDSLEELLLVGNPLFDQYKTDGNPLQTMNPYRIEVIKRCKTLKKLDGVPIEPEERDAAAN